MTSERDGDGAVEYTSGRDDVGVRGDAVLLSLKHDIDFLSVSQLVKPARYHIETRCHLVLKIGITHTDPDPDTDTQTGGHTQGPTFLIMTSWAAPSTGPVRSFRERNVFKNT